MTPKSSCPFSGHLSPLLCNLSDLLKADYAFIGIESFASVCFYFAPPWERPWGRIWPS
jgi:hypothetical protein